MQHSNNMCTCVCVSFSELNILTFAGLSSDVCGVLCGKHSLFAARTLAELPFPLAFSQPVLM